MTSSLAPVVKSVHSSITRPLPFHIAVMNLFLFLLLYAEWLIHTPFLSLGGTYNPTISALLSKPVCSAAVVRSYDIERFCWIPRMIGPKGFHLNLNSRCGCGRSRTLGHRNVFPLHHCLLFLPHPPNPLHFHPLVLQFSSTFIPAPHCSSPMQHH